ncbi:hypothetical protein GT348_00370 [Aristophania vespae]|uniref:Uncharacterized protein n=1 Tax=Aristophania vespae TaxID=2697033 RepID=A0A6P1NH39_9PROT|nr:hypothetical protein [Aristophania vespae]QHI94982.1 hypothetical protein GT348_00370 [Aristophania vespae]
MNNLNKLLEEGKAFQREENIPVPTGRLPSLIPWAVLAFSLVVVSLGIEVFWSLPSHRPLPLCGEETKHLTSCQKTVNPAHSSHKT